MQRSRRVLRGGNTDLYKFYTKGRRQGLFFLGGGHCRFVGCRFVTEEGRWKKKQNGENIPALLDTPIHSERQRGNRKCNRFRDRPPHSIICYLLLHPEQRGPPLPSSLFPLRRVASPCAVIKTTGGIRNAAWLLPACNRRHLVHKRGGGWGWGSPFPPPLRLKHQRCGSLIGPWRALEQKAILSSVFPGRKA